MNFTIILIGYDLGRFELLSKYMLLYVYTELFKMAELRKCARCRSEILLKYFALNRKGEYNKTCETCLSKNRKNEAVIICA